MSEYDAWVSIAFMIFAAIIVVAVFGFAYLTASNRIDSVLHDAFKQQDEKEKP